jgi:hypothetical protein
MFIPSLCQYYTDWLIYERRDKGFHQPQLGSSFWLDRLGVMISKGQRSAWH